MVKYETDDIATYTLVNGIIVTYEGDWVFLNKESMREINALIIEKINDPSCYRKKDKDGRFVKDDDE